MFNKIIGTALIISAFVLEISWLALCFGSVIVGIVLLIFAPSILLAPFSILFTLGMAFFAKEKLSNGSYYHYQYSNNYNYTNYSSGGLKRYYKILGCEEGDSLEKVKKAYKDLSRKYHPDLIHSRGADDKEIEFAKRKMQEINEAYSAIKNSFKQAA
jgi:hypothetical protein